MSLVLILIILNFFYVNKIEQGKKIFRKENQWSEFKKNLENNTLDYAFFGDSHTRNSINPNYINRSFNFATAAESYTETYYKIKHLLFEDEIKIKHFILQLDLHTFSESMRNKKRLFRELNYYSDYLDLKKISELKNKSLIKTISEEKFQILGKGKDFLSYFIPLHEKTRIEKGWVNVTKNFPKKNIEKITENKVEGHYSSQKQLFHNRSLSYFLKILKIAKENKINVIFIKYPVSIEYENELKKHNISRKEFYNKLYKIINKQNITYSVLDYHDRFFNDSKRFGDPDHLNHEGSTILSKEVKKDLKSLSKRNKTNNKKENVYFNFSIQH
ncbi:MAG: hypothetical protein ACQESF_07170 [Nanobdellota archaeon]